MVDKIKTMGAWAVVFLVGMSLPVQATFIDLTYNTFDYTPASASNPTFIDGEGPPAFDGDYLAMSFWSPTEDTSGFNALNPTAPTNENKLLDVFGTWGTTTTAPGAAVAGHITYEQPFRHNSSDYGVELPDGYVYLSVFTVPYADYVSTGIIPTDALYAVTPAFKVNFDSTLNPPPRPDEIGAKAAQAGPYSMAVIPEPGTLALFLMGSVAFLGWKRRFRRG